MKKIKNFPQISHFYLPQLPQLYSILYTVQYSRLSHFGGCKLLLQIYFLSPPPDIFPMQLLITVLFVPTTVCTRIFGTYAILCNILLLHVKTKFARFSGTNCREHHTCVLLKKLCRYVWEGLCKINILLFHFFYCVFVAKI